MSTKKKATSTTIPSPDVFRNIVTTLSDPSIHMASDGEGAAEFTGYIDTGCYILNALFSGSIYGGVPNNKITAFAGASATGKSFFVLSIVKNFLDTNENSGVFYFDTEAAITKEMMEQRGIDTKRVVILEPDSIQRFRFQALKVIDHVLELGPKRPPMMMVLDSLGMLSSSKELEDTDIGKETRDMTKASLIRATFRVLTLKCARARLPLILTNHTYAVVGSYIPTNEMSGGGGLKYSASTIAMLSKKKDRDGKEVVGNIIKVEMAKSRLSRENAHVSVKLSYDKGLDRYYGLLELADKYELIQKVSNRYQLSDGSKVFEKQIYENPEKYFTKELMDRIEEVAKREFMYGSSLPRATETEDDDTDGDG